VDLWREQVIKSVQTNPRIAFCYERMLAQQPSLSGTMALTISVGADGRTEKIVLNSDTLGSDRIEQCVALVIRSQSLPAPNTSTSFSVTLDFSPKE